MVVDTTGGVPLEGEGCQGLGAVASIWSSVAPRHRPHQWGERGPQAVRSGGEGDGSSVSWGFQEVHRLLFPWCWWADIAWIYLPCGRKQAECISRNGSLAVKPLDVSTMVGDACSLRKADQALGASPCSALNSHGKSLCCWLTWPQERVGWNVCAVSGMYWMHSTLVGPLAMSLIINKKNSKLGGPWWRRKSFLAPDWW